MESTPRMPGLVDQRSEPIEEPPPQKQPKPTPCKTTVSDLQKVFPHTSSTQLKQVADLINRYGKDFGIDSAAKLQHFLAQAGHESRSVVSGKPLIAFTENLSYRWAKLRTKGYWDRYFNPISNPTKDPNKADPRDYKHSTTSPFVDIEKFGNRVYNDKYRDSKHKLGNTQLGDGHKYIGRGLFQLTGRANYTDFNAFYRAHYDSKVDLLAHSDLVASDRKIMVISAFWYFKTHIESRISITDKTTVRSVTKYVNPKLTNLADRQKIFERAKTNIECH